MTIIAIPLALICTLALMIGGYVAYHYVNSDILSAEKAIREIKRNNDAHQALTLKLNAERLTRERSLAWQVYDACVENENQDETYARLFRKFYKLTLQAPPSPQRAEVLQALQDTIDAREPPGEPDCAQPSFPRPSNEATP